MPPTKHPIPGLAHLTVAGRTHTGTRNLEMWLETATPGHGTPIHSHDCEEIFVVLKGTGTMQIQSPSGAIFQQKLPTNSTITVLPNAKHQFINKGEEGDVQFLVAIDNAPMRAVVYKSWEDAHGRVMAPLPWDAGCPAAESNPPIPRMELSAEKIDNVAKKSEL